MNKFTAFALILSVSVVSVQAVSTGNGVACAVTASSNCSNCGDATSQALFTYDSSNNGNCKFTDCSTKPASLNGWICQSCNGVSGSSVPDGQYFYGSSCSNSCKGATVSNSWVCTSNSTLLVFALLLSLIALLL
ncbi:immobilization antigen (macronuclear) [Tetrahymena thermophila SB210]|uniref:Immobilization antigen n=1 Tax=Tetrahymena thermophila (strain SB210) TaxID=312017 RepID=Q23U75_TETTS|nr:immobilization antigen [Tetrahymena thermophila SB210]EAS00069.1 immobilization antigen [Tetrahymena thermophila SB210]|eukprot:XP_001020314.1 immobilization antigen [Tetrahymena thermophila SB210]